MKVDKGMTSLKHLERRIIPQHVWIFGTTVRTLNFCLDE
jgi:hypothetical protein